MVAGPATADLAAAEAGGRQGAARPKLSVAEILRLAAPEYVERHGPAPQVQGTLAKLSLCRTAALGERRYRCEGCERECVLYNSCGDRHCPQCAGAKRADWLDSTEGLLLDRVPYFQVVFTLPGELSSLALGNRRVIYNLLFVAAWSALKESIESEQGYDPAALMVLHTWNQKLDAHAHVHAVVPGGGPARDGRGWVSSRRRDDDGRREDYLVDAVNLRRRYRDRFLAGLDRLREEAGLKLEGDFEHLRRDDSWNAFVRNLEATEWVSYIQPPPRKRDDEGTCGPEQVLKYLARYLTGGPISDARIIAADEREVTFWAREGLTTGGNDDRVPVTLPTVEFVRRWSLHVLPKGYTKTRRFGGWSNTRRERYLERCAILLEATSIGSSPGATEFDVDALDKHDRDEDERRRSTGKCPACGGTVHMIREDRKPAWSSIMNSESRPAWYAFDTS